MVVGGIAGPQGNSNGEKPDTGEVCPEYAAGVGGRF